MEVALSGDVQAMLPRVLLVTMMLAIVAPACVESAEVTCGDYVCPGGTRCMSTGIDGRPPRCVTPAQIAACVGIEPFQPCGDGRRCYPLVEGVACLDEGCGNDFVDPGEQCDDGNTQSLDHCSADCTSNETCGNGVVDPLLGELCDDGNLLSHDGCASACKLERLDYVDTTPQPIPNLVGSSVAFDHRRGRVVVAGGRLDTGCLQCQRGESDVRELTGGDWITVAPPVSPVFRNDPAMAYAGDLGVTLFFGGGGFGDFWDWNGTIWRPHDESGPAGRTYPRMIYDSRRHRAVLFGGAAVSSSEPQLWEWDGTRTPPVWSAPAIPSVPLGLADYVHLAYDEQRGVTVLTTYTPGVPGVDASQIWERTDGAWASRGQLPFAAMGMAFDPATNRILLLEGTGDTYTWDGTLHGTGATLGGETPILVGDPVRGGVLAIVPESSLLTQVMFWNGTSWSALPSGGGWPAGAGTSVVLDPVQGRLIAFGGTETPDTTWVFDRRTWQATTGATQPSGRTGAAMAYRIASAEAILFGGLTGATVSGETWAWNGSWRQLAVSGPSARRLASVAYDSGRDRVVLFGGTTATTGDDRLGPCDCNDQTWEWDGSSWTMNPAAVHPPALREAAMAYDPVRRQIILFGGLIESSVESLPNDTWAYDGTWTKLAPTTAPPGRAGAALAWNPARQRLVLSGGFVSANSQVLPPPRKPLADVWEWDGQRWRSVPPSERIAARGGHVAVPDLDGAGVLLVGGTTEGFVSLVERPHTLLWRADTTEETCTTRGDADRDGLAACADPDCWTFCEPLCPPGIPCAGPRCGDGMCGSLENATICARDCGAPNVSCGDALCDPGETCAADCP